MVVVLDNFVAAVDRLQLQHCLEAFDVGADLEQLVVLGIVAAVVVLEPEECH